MSSSVTNVSNVETVSGVPGTDTNIVSKDNDVSTGSINITTGNCTTGTAGSIVLTAGTSTSGTNGSIAFEVQGQYRYIWPTSPPPNDMFVLGIESYSTTDGITTYQLGWTPGSICFHASTTVTLENGTKVPMSQLRYHDRVLAVDRHMNFIYSPVVDFTGVFPNRSGPCVKIFYKSPRSEDKTDSLIVSGLHMLYCSDEKSNKGSFICAQNIVPGMKLLGVDNKFTDVTKVQISYDVGWYTPLTQHGTIVVNDVVGSCHTNGPQSMVRFMYGPLYWYLYFFPKKANELPKPDVNHWFSIRYRRGPVGKTVERFLRLFRWS
jgi:hypothetical protein